MVYICRLCLKSYPESRPELIFSVNSKDQNGVVVTTLMKTLIPEVYLGISPNPLVCHICYKSLNAAYSFRLKCLRSENLIAIYMREQGTTPPVSVDLDNVIEYWMTTYSAKRGAKDVAKENLIEWFGIHADQNGELVNKLSERPCASTATGDIPETIQPFIKSVEGSESVVKENFAVNIAYNPRDSTDKAINNLQDSTNTVVINNSEDSTNKATTKSKNSTEEVTNKTKLVRGDPLKEVLPDGVADASKSDLHERTPIISEETNDSLESDLYLGDQDESHQNSIEEEGVSDNNDELAQDKSSKMAFDEEVRRTASSIKREVHTEDFYQDESSLGEIMPELLSVPGFSNQNSLDPLGFHFDVAATPEPRPEIRVRPESALKQSSRTVLKPNLLRQHRKVVKVPKKPFSTTLNLKSPDLPPLILNSRLAQTVLKQPMVRQGNLLVSPQNMSALKKTSRTFPDALPGTRLVAMTLDQLNLLLSNGSLVPGGQTSGNASTPAAATISSGLIPIAPAPSPPPPPLPVARVEELGESREDALVTNNSPVNIKQEPLDYHEAGPSGLRKPSSGPAADEWNSESILSSSETSLVDRLLHDQMPVLGEEEFDQPEYVSVTHMTTLDGMPILEPAVPLKETKQPPSSKVSNVTKTPAQKLAARIKEQISEKMTVSKEGTKKAIKRAAVKESESEQPPAKSAKTATKPPKVTESSKQQSNDDEPKDVCVLYTNFTGEGSYINDHDYLISPYLRNNMVSYRSGRKMCQCMLCDTSHPAAIHSTHMKCHSTKCIICGVDFQNVFILNLHVRGHTFRCFDCEVNVTYARYSHHEKVHHLNVIKNEKARIAEEKAEADSILKVLLAEKVDAPPEEVISSQTTRPCRRSSRRPRLLRPKPVNRPLLPKKNQKKTEEITLEELLNSSVKPDAKSVNLQLLSSATQKDDGPSKMQPPVLAKPNKRRKKKFLLSRPRKSHRVPIQKKETAAAEEPVKTENVKDENCDEIPIIEVLKRSKPASRSTRRSRPSASKDPEKSTVKKSPRNQASKRRVPSHTEVSDEPCEDPLSLDNEKEWKIGPNNIRKIPLMSDLLFETMTPIKIVKVDDKKIVVAPIGPEMKVRPSTPKLTDASDKSPLHSKSNDESQSSSNNPYCSFLEETEKLIQETRALRRSRTAAGSNSTSHQSSPKRNNAHKQLTLEGPDDSASVSQVLDT